MAASSAMFIVCRSSYDLMSMCVVMNVFGMVTSSPSVGFPFTCEPSVYTKSLGFHFLLWGLVCMIVVVVCGCNGVGLSLSDVLQSMSLAFGLVLSIRAVLTL